VLVVDLRWETGSWNFEIPARSRGFLVATDADDVIVARVHPTPYMTEFDLFGSDLVASCSGD